MDQLNTPFPLGVMVGGPNGGDSGAMDRFTQQYNSFTDLMGTAPRFMNGFVDPAKPIGEWPSNASWTAWSWRQSPLLQNITPVIGLPMATSGDRGNADAVFKAFAAGQHDDVLHGVVKAWAEHGYTSLYFRPGYEMNLPGMAWYAGTDRQTQKDWVAAFQHIADVVHSVSGVDVKVIWNPNSQSWNTGGDVRALYPGDGYVDVVGADIYSPQYPRNLYDWDRNDGTLDANFAQWSADPVNRAHYWTYPDANQWRPTGDGDGNSLSVQNVIDFAKAHGKPLAIVETGVGSGASGTQGPNDDPAFPKWLASTLADSGANVAMVNIWDLNPGDGDWTFSGAGANKPQTAAAWAANFGAGAKSGGSATSGASISVETVQAQSSLAFLAPLAESSSAEATTVPQLMTAGQDAGTILPASDPAGLPPTQTPQGYAGVLPNVSGEALSIIPLG